MDEAEFEAIISRKDIVKIRQLAEMPDLPLDFQRKLFAYPDSEAKNSIVKKINDKSIVDSVLASGDPMVMRVAVRNPLVTRDQLAAAAEIMQTDLLEAVASNAKSDLAILKRCREHARQDKYPFAINGAIVTNPNATSDLIQEIFDEFGLPEESYYGYNRYLENLASGPQTPLGIFKLLSTKEDKSWGKSLISALVNNPSVTLEIQREIFERGGEEERVVVAKSEGTKTELLEQILSLDDAAVKEAMVRRRTLIPEFFNQLFTDSEPRVRAAFASRDDLTAEHVKQLVIDKSALVREAVAYYDVDDLSLLDPLIEDTSIKVSTALCSLKKREKSFPFHYQALLPAPERENLAKAAALFKSGVKPKKKPVTIGDKVGFIKVEELTHARYEELVKDESVTLRVAGIMRGHELGLIDLKTAVRLLDDQGGVGTAPREAWLKDRALNWQSIQLQTVLEMQLWFRSSIEDLLNARNKLPEDFLLRILKIHYGKYNWLVYENQKVTKACLLALVETEIFFCSKQAGSFVQIAMLTHPLMDVDVYMALTGCKFKAVRAALFSAEKTPMEILRLGLEDKDGEIRGGVIANPRFKYSEVEKFLKERGYASKIGVLRRSDCPAPVLAEFAVNKQLEIRTTVADNPSTPVDSLLILAGDEDSMVRRLASKNPSATPEVKAIASLLK
jgi:hypothetical protein